MNATSLIVGLQALCGSARSFLGPGPVFKCVLDGDDPKSSALVGDVRSLLLAMDGDPTVTGLLLETLEGQVGGMHTHARPTGGQGKHVCINARVQKCCQQCTCASSWRMASGKSLGRSHY